MSTFEFFKRASNSALRLSNLQQLTLHTQTRCGTTLGDAEVTTTVLSSRKRRKLRSELAIEFRQGSATRISALQGEGNSKF